MTLGHLLQVPEPRDADVLPRTLDDRLDLLPDHHVLAVRVEEEVLVQEAFVHERGDHLPVRRRHAEMTVHFVAAQVVRADFVPGLGIEIGEHEGAGATHLGIAAQLVEAKDQLHVVGRGTRHRFRPFYRTMEGGPPFSPAPPSLSNHGRTSRLAACATSCTPTEPRAGIRDPPRSAWSSRMRTATPSTRPVARWGSGPTTRRST